MDSQASPLTQEIPGGVAEIVARRYLTDPDVTLASYAAPGMDGCSATMIGPNLLMSAAHCGANDHSITFRTYRNHQVTSSDTETFACHYLLQTFSETDLLLLYCEPNAAGQNPGDKYGYLDLDTAPAQIGDRLYSIWTNPVNQLQIGDARIFSQGDVTSITDSIWYGGVFSNRAVQMSIWGQPGASGSSDINFANHRVKVGPTSTAPGNGGRQRWALSMSDYMTLSRVDGNSQLGLNRTELQALGLNPQSYDGLMDKNGDRVFDVQEDLERLRGENRRDYYWLGFESERRNALWGHWPGIIDPVNRTAHVVSQYAGVPLRHEHLNLKPNTSYRGSIMTYTNQSTYRLGLEVRIVDRPPHQQPSFSSVVQLPTVAGTGWQLQTFHFRTAGYPSELQLATNFDIDLYLSTFSLIEEASVMDFDTHDKRYNWRNDNDGSRAFILPDGRATDTPNWAALVQHTGQYPNGNDWPLRNRQLALLKSESQTLCFDVKRYAGAGSNPWGVMRVKSDNQIVALVRFTPSTAWTQVCTQGFVPQSSDNNVQFGVDGAPAGSSYLVDNIRWRRG